MVETTQLRAILTDLQQLAQQAYWQDLFDCGRDWNSERECENCRHNVACGLTVSIKRGISNLAKQEGG